jgi:hypothetical protein
MPLSKEEREALGDDLFAFPRLRKCPLNDEKHTRLAWDMVDRTQGATMDERAEARRRILHRAKELGIDTSDWDKTVSASALQLWGMSLNVPEVENHPNRMPFSGVLTFVNQPSDLPPGGSGGKRTYLPKDVAEKALESLLGMAIDFSDDLSGHDVTQKIGIITSAEIVGDELRIEGFLYAADFPQECARIQEEKEDLGFSYELQAKTRPMGDLLQIVSCVFTGAAVLYKDKAAYQSTSLAAQAEQELEMTEDQMKALLAGALTPITEAIGTINKEVAAMKAAGDAALQANKETRDRVAPHAAALRSCAAAMEASGIGLHSAQGHVKVLHHMAASMEADAAAGKVPHIFRDHDWGFSAGAEGKATQAAAVVLDETNPAIKALTDQISGLGTQMTDLKAAAFKAAEGPGRKTVPSDVLALLAKGGIKEAPADGMTEQQIDVMLEAAGVTKISDRIAAKQKIASSGLLRG